MEDGARLLRKRLPYQLHALPVVYPLGRDDTRQIIDIFEAIPHLLDCPLGHVNYDHKLFHFHTPKLLSKIFSRYPPSVLCVDETLDRAPRGFLDTDGQTEMVQEQIKQFSCNGQIREEGVMIIEAG
jgi:hypothetical protein